MIENALSSFTNVGQPLHDSGDFKICKGCGILYPKNTGHGCYHSYECYLNSAHKGLRRECAYQECRKIYYASRAQVRRGRGIYCSKVCQYKDRTLKIELNCDYCGQPFLGYPNRKYCAGHKCPALGRWNGKTMAEEVTCTFCGVVFYRKQSQMYKAKTIKLPSGKHKLIKSNIRKTKHFHSRECWNNYIALNWPEANYGFFKLLSDPVARYQQKLDALASAYTQGITSGRIKYTPEFILELKNWDGATCSIPVCTELKNPISPYNACTQHDQNIKGALLCKRKQRLKLLEENGVATSQVIPEINQDLGGIYEAN